MVLAALDRGRSAALRAFGPSLRSLLAERPLRIAVLGSVAVLASAATALWIPLLMVVLAPIVLGVPHLVSDVRYLVVKPRLHRRPWVVLLVGVPLACTWLRPNLDTGLLAVLGALLAARGPWPKKLLWASAFACVYALVMLHPYVAGMLLLHGHHLVAFAVFLLIFARSLRHALAPTLVFAAFTGALLLGVFDPVIERPAALFTVRSGTGLEQAIAELSPSGSFTWGMRFVALFVFAQSVHYGLWLRLIPEEARERPGLRSFTSSFRALRADVGVPVLVLALGAMVFFGYQATQSFHHARYAYLHLAVFHGYLELACLALVLVEGRAAFRQDSPAGAS